MAIKSRGTIIMFLFSRVLRRQ